jgi:inosine-uridine nucleoside N-ribohydrolase
MDRRKFVKTAGMTGLALGVSNGANAFDQAGISQNNNSIKMIYDGDIGPDPCDFATLSMLHEYHNKEYIDLVGIIGSTPDPYLASTFSIYNQLYDNNIPIAAYNGVSGKVAYSNKVKLTYNMAIKAINYKDQNKTVYEKYGAPQTKTAKDVPCTIELYRRLLSQAEDNSITIYIAGQLFNYPALLSSQSDEISPFTGEELLQKKVKEFVFMGGYFPRSSKNTPYMFTSNAEWNWWALGEPDITKNSLEALIRMGKPITYIGAEIGPRVLTGKELVRRLGREHPTSEAYLLYRPISKGQNNRLRKDNPAYDEVALFVNVEGGIGKYFGEVKGSVRVNRKGANTWVPGDGNQRYITLLPGVEEELVKVITDRVTGKF